MLLVDGANHLLAHDFESRTAGNRGGRGQTKPRNGRKCFFTHEILRGKECDGGFLACRGDDRYSSPALLQIENRVRWVTLREEMLIRLQLDDSPAEAGTV